MNQTSRKTYVLYLFISLCIAAVFIIDLQLPLGIAIGVLYVIPVLISLGGRSERLTYGIAFLCTLLVIIGLYKSVPDADLWKVLLNRTLAFLVIWVTASLGLLNKRKDRRLGTIIETVVDGLITIDEQGLIRDFNPAAERIFGYQAVEVLGRNVKMLMPEPYHSEHDGYLWRYLDTGQARVIGKRRELTGMRKDATVFPMDLAVSEMRLGAGRLFVGTVRDITDRKRSEQDLRKARDAAEEASRSKARFLANMSHELRTPLNAIIGYSEMLKEDAEQQGGTAMLPDLQRIHTAGRHLMELISDILDLSKIEAGKLSLSPQTFPVAELLETIRTTVLPMVAQKGNALTVRTGGDCDTLHADPTRLRQCLLNLLSNAAKFTEKGEITLEIDRRTVPKGEQMVFRVSDTGIGMSAEVLEHAFDAFVQADEIIPGKYTGTGLGLAITRELAQLMGGDLSAESEPGRGSTFTLWLPLRRRKPYPVPAPTDSDRKQTAAEEALPLVLVIDDEAEARELLTRSLSGKGYRVVAAGGGEEGLVLARRLRPSAITLDVLMPGLDGWDVLAALKADPELVTIPVIICSILDEANHGFALGAGDYLIKPIDRGRLLELLSKYCRKDDCKVLVVEDDPISREMLARTLRKAGCHQVWEAGNGRQALAQLAEETPDVILLDLMMPEMDGFEFIEALQQDETRREIPVVLLTAKDLSAADHRRLNGYVTSIIEKGRYGSEELLGTIVRQLRLFVMPGPSAPDDGKGTGP